MFNIPLCEKISVCNEVQIPVYITLVKGEKIF
jgi:hypothetical protein